MKNRRGFLATLSAISGAAWGLGVSAKAEPPAAGAATPSSPPAPKPQPLPSAASLAIAATFRRFDPKLSDDELHKIAANIDQSRTGAVLNPKKKPLRNSDEMVVRFAADERIV